MDNNFLNQNIPNSTLGNIGELIAKKYPSRELTASDPAPIMINCDTKGPLNVSGGFIMCDGCGHIIRANYLSNHKSSGACERIIEKKKQRKDSLVRNNIQYDGPYVSLSNSSEPSGQQLRNKQESNIM